MSPLIASAITQRTKQPILCFGSFSNVRRPFDWATERDQTFLIIFAIRWDVIMLVATIRNLLRDVQEVFRRAAVPLASLGAERRCAMRLDSLADRLLVMAERINLLRSRMLEEVGEAVDGDHALRDALKGLKEDIREIRCQLAGMRSPRLSARLQRAFTRLGTVAEETYSCADKLQWEIEDHDRRFV